MSEGVLFSIGAVMFTITTSATFLFLMLRFNQVYEARAEVETPGSAVSAEADLTSAAES